MIQEHMSLKHEPSSEPLHISAEYLFLNSERLKTKAWAGDYEDISVESVPVSGSGGRFRRRFNP